VIGPTATAIAGGVAANPCAWVLPPRSTGEGEACGTSSHCVKAGVHAVMTWKRRAAVFVATAAYLAATVLLLRERGRVSPGALELAAAPGVIFGLLVPDWRILLVPVMAVGGSLVLGYASDPQCSRCGNDDNWTLLTAYAVVLLIPLFLGLGIGVLGRRAASRWLGARS
jgi:hypothetical protein